MRDSFHMIIIIIREILEAMITVIKMSSNFENFRRHFYRLQIITISNNLSSDDKILNMRASY